MARYKTRKTAADIRRGAATKPQSTEAPISTRQEIKSAVRACLSAMRMTHIMYLVTKSLKYNRNKIINNLTAVIQSIIAMDTTGTDVPKLQGQIKKIEGNG